MTPTFEKTVDILVKAYLNDTLRHGDCEACAVGNIVHAAGAPRYQSLGLMPDSCGAWKGIFYTDSDDGIQTISDAQTDYFYRLGLNVIGPTGYEWHELAKVEFAFEMADRGASSEDWMFNGLMAVVDVLAEIHNVDLSVREEAKLLFVKP